MLYALICKDKPNSLQIRTDNRNSHLEYLDGLGSRLKAAGPFVDGEENPTGSLIIVESNDEGGARKISEDDPYAQAGLFDSVEIRPWKWLIKNPEA